MDTEYSLTSNGNHITVKMDELRQEVSITTSVGSLELTTKYMCQYDDDYGVETELIEEANLEKVTVYSKTSVRICAVLLFKCETGSHKLIAVLICGYNNSDMSTLFYRSSQSSFILSNDKHKKDNKLYLGNAHPNQFIVETGPLKIVSCVLYAYKYGTCVCLA